MLFAGTSRHSSLREALSRFHLHPQKLPSHLPGFPLWLKEACLVPSDW